MEDSFPQKIPTKSSKISSPPHKFQNLHKSTPGKVGDQEKRREIFLQNQKEKRRNDVNILRKLAGIEDFEDFEESTETNEYFSDCDEEFQESQEKSEKNNPKRFHLMSSEWLEKIPENFEQDWFAVVCPIGKRCLVIASKGNTKVWLRNGSFFDSFDSFLPSGNRMKKNHQAQNWTALDCIFVEQENTFYILDLICWNGFPVYQSEAEFRSFWLASKFCEWEAENPQISPKFRPLFRTSSCSREDIFALVCSHKYSFHVDGFLFFHKRGHYLMRKTPLCCWLKPDMLNPVLHYQLPPVGAVDSQVAVLPATADTSGMMID